MKRNWQALALRAFGGRDFRLTVLATEPVNERYHRLRLDGGDLLTACGVHPTMWIRLWFDNDGKAHQRAYTLVDPDPATGEFSLEFALHDGCAARWATTAKPGDTIAATVQGSAFALPDPAPSHLWLVGDAASVPAINSLLDAAGEIPATVFLEHAHDAEKDLPVRAKRHHAVTWVERRDGGHGLVDTVVAALPAETGGGFYWVTCEAGSARSITRHVRNTLGAGKTQLYSLGYWRAA